jgi:predicted transglutaminase-like cysteine proteinase
MLKTIMTAAVVAASMLAGAGQAAAAGPGGLARNLANNPTVSYIVAKRQVMGPFAHATFCASNPSECKTRGGATMMVLTSHRESQLNSVNRSVNASIRATNESGGADVWKVGGASGDCEDFALAKRRQLISLGWSPRALRMAVARTRSGEGHAVLVVKTSRGDLVLDNRTSAIKPWKNTDLRWVKIQSGDNPRRWYAM